MENLWKVARYVAIAIHLQFTGFSLLAHRLLLIYSYMSLMNPPEVRIANTVRIIITLLASYIVNDSFLIGKRLDNKGLLTASKIL